MNRAGVIFTAVSHNLSAFHLAKYPNAVFLNIVQDLDL